MLDYPGIFLRRGLLQTGEKGLLSTTRKSFDLTIEMTWCKITWDQSIELLVKSFLSLEQGVHRDIGKLARPNHVERY